MIKWGIRLLVLVALLTGADRLLVGVAQGQLASRLQKVEHLAKRPTVQIGGFPFLTQVSSGTYDDVRLVATDLVRGRLRITRLEVDAKGVQVRVLDVIQGHVVQVPVREGTVRATIAFTSIDDALRGYARDLAEIRTSAVPDMPGRVRLDGVLNLPGGPYRLSGAADVALVNGVLKVTPLPDVFNLVPTVVRAQAIGLLTAAVPLPSLPFGVKLVSAQVDPTGVVLVADARGVVIRTR